MLTVSINLDVRCSSVQPHGSARLYVCWFGEKSNKMQIQCDQWAGEICSMDFPCYNTTAPFFFCPYSVWLPWRWLCGWFIALSLPELSQYTHTQICKPFSRCWSKPSVPLLLLSRQHLPAHLIRYNLLHIKNLLRTAKSNTHTHMEGYYDSRNKWHMLYFALVISGREGKGRISIHFNHCCFSLSLPAAVRGTPAGSCILSQHLVIQ